MGFSLGLRLALIGIVLFAIISFQKNDGSPIQYGSRYSMEIVKICNAKDGCFNIELIEDFEFLKSSILLLDGGDTVDQYVRNDAYGERGTIEIIQDSIIKYQYLSRAGYGMRRVENTFLFLRDSKLNLLFTIVVLEEFSDELFDVPKHDLNCSIRFIGDEVVFNQTIFEDSVLVSESSKSYSLTKLMSGEDKVE